MDLPPHPHRSRRAPSTRASRSSSCRRRAPGFELQPIRTLSGKRTNITFYDGVHVGDEWRVGEVDGGWQVMLVALSFERGVAGGVRDAERLLRVAEEHARTATRRRRASVLLDDATRTRATSSGSRSTARSPTSSPARAAWVAASGGLPGIEGAAAQAVRHRGVHPRRRAGLLDARRARGAACGRPTVRRPRRVLRVLLPASRPSPRIYGGTSEIQRNLVAQRGLGLPRAR